MDGSIRARVLYDGLISGLLGYIVVAFVVGLLDVAGGRSFFHTPSLLGQIVVGGFGPPTPGAVAAGPVLAFNGLHLLVFLILGLVVSFVVFEVELHPVFWYAGFFALLVLLMVSFFVLAVVSVPLGEDPDAVTLVVANALAAFAIAAWLARAHPRLLETIRERGDPES